MKLISFVALLFIRGLFTGSDASPQLWNTGFVTGIAKTTKALVEGMEKLGNDEDVYVDPQQLREMPRSSKRRESMNGGDHLMPSLVPLVVLLNLWHHA